MNKMTKREELEKLQKEKKEIDRKIAELKQEAFENETFIVKWVYGSGLKLMIKGTTYRRKCSSTSVDIIKANYCKSIWEADDMKEMKEEIKNIIGELQDIYNKMEKELQEDGEIVRAE